MASNDAQVVSFSDQDRLLLQQLLTRQSLAERPATQPSDNDSDDGDDEARDPTPAVPVEIPDQCVEGRETDIVDRVNQIKQTCAGQSGGVFYVNEYHHLIVPITHNGSSHYFYGGRADPDFAFEFEGALLTTKPIGRDGQPLSPGDPWIGPRPGIPYVLAAGGSDIYFETPALTDVAPPSVRAGVTRKVMLSKALRDRALVARAVGPIWEVRGHQGGRFYVNEHGSAFTPVDRGDGNGLNYIYCGQIDPAGWFPEPPVP